MTRQTFMQWLQDVIAPRLNVLEGKIDALIAKMDAFQDTMRAEHRRHDQRDDSFEHEARSRFDSVEKRIDGLDRRLETTIALHERIAAIEARLGTSHN